ncbi:two-component system chemotaxis sensor kinase CheA [Kineococcus radiotolerans]|uniref:Chemotaxis protein CheA n=1 Tax=Kineococcus radiotolerans TaxID=131568 RepID=A0A7W4TIG0_KINRA|nr:chemotaxis protein CheA [Kineococcus radiotolerans]MBB2899544.1 two-component system chemotaxis sensor kinase CheA [Kineococcus radiotolerans]
MTNPLLVQFVAESADLLADVDEGLLRLEAEPGDGDLVNAVFRAAHTFKGSSGLFDLPELTRLTHAAEDLLDAVRAGRLPLTPEMVDALLSAFDTVRRWMPVIEATGRTPGDAGHEADSQSAVLRSWLGGGEAPTEGAPVPQGTSGGTAGPTAPADLPSWVLDLPAERLEQLRAWLATTAATVRAVRYEPDAACFFRGEDPLNLFRQVPALELLHTAPAEPFAGIDEVDEYECVLRFTALTRAAVGELAHVFRYVPEQVEVVEVSADNLARLLDGTPAEPGPAPDAAAASAPDPLHALLLQAQCRLLARVGADGDDVADGPPLGAARVRSAAGVALRVATAAGLDTVPGVAALAEFLATGSAGPLVSWIAATAAGAGTPAPTVAEQGEAAAAVPAPRTSPEDDTAPAPAPAEDPSRAARVLKVEQAKVDKLLDLVGELVVAKNALPFVAQEAEDAGSRALARRVLDEYAVVSRVSEELQQAVMDVRMLPVSTAFARAPRLVRDLSRKLGKKVRLVQEGEDTAADKDVIEMLTEPLVHLVRNSLDHGIETPEQRVAAGKPEEATLLLRAAPDGDAVLVEIVDDGRGIDTDAVRRKAYERGLISEEALETLPDEEAAQLIFAPGFSTAEVISDVSGRGVGMDAVRSSIERLGGSVSMENRRGRSLTVRLRLPLTMAVSKVLLLTAGGQRFGVPLDDVVETVRVDREEVTRVAGHPVLALRDDVVPLVSLGGLLGAGGDLSADALNVLVVRTATGPLGLVVDRFHQNTDVILKPLEGFLAGTPGYCGTALLGDGLVLLVLDVKELNSRAAALR